MKVVTSIRHGKSVDYWHGYWDCADRASNAALNAEHISEYVKGWNRACDDFPNEDYSKLKSDGFPVGW